MLGHFLLLHVRVHNLLLQTRKNKAVKTGKNCRVRLPRIYERKHIDKVLKVDSHLQFIRNELLSELFVALSIPFVFVNCASISAFISDPVFKVLFYIPEGSSPLSSCLSL